MLEKLPAPTPRTGSSSTMRQATCQIVTLPSCRRCVALRRRLQMVDDLGLAKPAK